jgi:hypothetical protein
MAVLPTRREREDADDIAAELTKHIMTGMDCVNPSKFEQHIKSVLSSYIANEFAERRRYAAIAFTSPRREPEDAEPKDSDHKQEGK